MADLSSGGHAGGGVAGTGDADGFYTCERCGKRKPVDFTCSCGGAGGGPTEGSGEPQGGAPVDRVVPEGWDPELTRSSRPRLSIVRGPDQGGEPHGAEPADVPERGE